MRKYPPIPILGRNMLLPGRGSCMNALDICANQLFNCYPPKRSLLWHKGAPCARMMPCVTRLAHHTGACTFYFCPCFWISFLFSALCFCLFFFLVLVEKTSFVKNHNICFCEKQSYASPERKKHNMHLDEKHTTVFVIEVKPCSRGSIINLTLLLAEAQTALLREARLYFHRKGAVLFPKSIDSAS